MTASRADPLEATKAWVRSFVIGRSMCPFAAPVERAGRIHYATRPQHVDPIGFALNEAIALLQAPPERRSTSLLLYPHDYHDFGHFLALVAQVQAALSMAGADGVLQVATFHPHYVFADAPEDDPANATNRSPVAMLHLLREDEVSAAIAAHPAPLNIPARNAQLLRREAEER